MTQKDLSSHQQRWIDRLNDFDFKIIYIPGEDNVITDALSQMYSYNPPSLVCAPSEFIQDEEAPLLPSQLRGLTQPMLTCNVAEIGLDLLMVDTSALQYVACSRTGNAQSRTLTSARGITVLPVSEEARNALVKSSRGHGNRCGEYRRPKCSVVPKEGRSTPSLPPPDEFTMKATGQNQPDTEQTHTIANSLVDLTSPTPALTQSQI